MALRRGSDASDSSGAGRPGPAPAPHAELPSFSHLLQLDFRLGLCSLRVIRSGPVAQLGGASVPVRRPPTPKALLSESSAPSSAPCGSPSPPSLVGDPVPATRGGVGISDAYDDDDGEELFSPRQTPRQPTAAWEAGSAAEPQAVMPGFLSTPPAAAGSAGGVGTSGPVSAPHPSRFSITRGVNPDAAMPDFVVRSHLSGSAAGSSGAAASVSTLYERGKGRSALQQLVASGKLLGPHPELMGNVLKKQGARDPRGVVLLGVQLTTFEAKVGLWAVESRPLPHPASSSSGASGPGPGTGPPLPAPTRLQLSLQDLCVYDGVSHPGSVYKLVSKSLVGSDAVSTAAAVFLKGRHSTMKGTGGPIRTFFGMAARGGGVAPPLLSQYGLWTWSRPGCVHVPCVWVQVDKPPRPPPCPCCGLTST